MISPNRSSCVHMNCTFPVSAHSPTPAIPDALSSGHLDEEAASQAHATIQLRMRGNISVACRTTNHSLRQVLRMRCCGGGPQCEAWSSPEWYRKVSQCVLLCLC